MTCEIALPAADVLGESPVWRPESGTLSRVDISAGAIKVFDPRSGEDRTAVTASDPVGFAIPRRDGGWIAGAGRRLVLYPEGQVVAEVEHERESNRFNDAACDARGRLWAGTMSTVRAPGEAALYRIGSGWREVEPVLTGVGLSNGLDWSADGTTMYHTDSLEQRVDVIDFDVDAGRLGDRRPFVRVAERDGLPDGLTVDAEDHVWLALFGGGALRRYAPDGRLDREIRLPVTNPTSAAFGGAALTDLYVTSARHLLTPEQLASEPLAGSLLRLDVGVAGRPAHLAP